MAHAKFRFISDASGGDRFTVVSFTGREAISSLYRYEIEIKSPLAASIDLDDVLDSPARFISELEGVEYPVNGVLSSFDELQTVQGYVYYRAVLVPKLWWLSLYKTNEIYTEELTVDKIIETVLQNAGLTSDVEFDLDGLDKSRFLERDYVCQFGESDFDFISRLMENEGIFYYFEQGETTEKIIFINDMNYMEMPRPALVFEVATQTPRQHDSINAWSCRKQRLPESVTVRDFNPAQPSLDISDTMPIDNMGHGTEYLYGENIESGDEATYLSEIRAEERLCSRTRYYGESGVNRMQAGYSFALDGHPNTLYNGVEYLVLEVNHDGMHLDMDISSGQTSQAQTQPEYHNNFVALDASEQFRPPRKTPKPRFYGTMTAFIYAETSTTRPEVDQHGRYRVHLPFDRADGTKSSTDPDRKSSAWIRMAQPYVGQDQGMYFPLTGGAEVLLTFINGDPDQPIISAALPNASQPSLMEDNPEWASMVTKQVTQQITGNTQTISANSTRLDYLESPPSESNPTGTNAHYINDGNEPAGMTMIPPWTGLPLTSASPAYDECLVKFKLYDEDFAATDMNSDNIGKVSTDRGGGDSYGYANGRTFYYPQHERVYFIGSFHEDFHLKDDFLTAASSGTGIREQYTFPPPGEDFPDGTDPSTSSDSEVNPNGVRGVSEDRRWGDQMNYAWGRSFNWAGGTAMEGGESFAEYNYGNGYTENLQTKTGGTSQSHGLDGHTDEWTYASDWKPDDPVNMAKIMAPIAIGISFILGGGGLTGAIAAGARAGVTYGLAAFRESNESDDDLVQTWYLNPVSTAVEKTWGHTYSYQKGLAVDIHEGNTIARNYGDTNEWNKGNVESVTEGDSVSTTVGSASEAFLGSKYEFNLATADALTVGTSNEAKLSADTEIFLGLKQEFTLAAGIYIDLGAKLELEAFKTNKTEFDAKAAIATLEGTVNDIKTTQGAVIEECKMTFAQAAVELDSAQLKFGAHNLNMIG